MKELLLTILLLLCNVDSALAGNNHFSVMGMVFNNGLMIHPRGSMNPGAWKLIYDISMIDMVAEALEDRVRYEADIGLKKELTEHLLYINAIFKKNVRGEYALGTVLKKSCSHGVHFEKKSTSLPNFLDVLACLTGLYLEKESSDKIHNFLTYSFSLSPEMLDRIIFNSKGINITVKEAISYLFYWNEKESRLWSYEFPYRPSEIFVMSFLRNVLSDCMLPRFFKKLCFFVHVDNIIGTKKDDVIEGVKNSKMPFFIKNHTTSSDTDNDMWETHLRSSITDIIIDISKKCKPTEVNFSLSRQESDSDTDTDSDVPFPFDDTAERP